MQIHPITVLVLLISTYIGYFLSLQPDLPLITSLLVFVPLGFFYLYCVDGGFLPEWFVENLRPISTHTTERALPQLRLAIKDTSNPTTEKEEQLKLQIKQLRHDAEQSRIRSAEIHKLHAIQVKTTQDNQTTLSKYRDNVTNLTIQLDSSQRSLWNAEDEIAELKRDLKRSLHNHKSQPSTEIALIPQPSVPSIEAPLQASVAPVSTSSVQMSSLQADLAQEKRDHEATKNALYTLQQQPVPQPQILYQQVPQPLPQPDYDLYKSHSLALDNILKGFTLTLRNKEVYNDGQETTIENLGSWVLNILPQMIEGLLAGEKSQKTLISLAEEATKGHAYLTGTTADPDNLVDTSTYICEITNKVKTLHDELKNLKNATPVLAPVQFPVQPAFSVPSVPTTSSDSQNEKTLRFIQKHYDLYIRMRDAADTIAKDLDPDEPSYPKWHRVDQKSVRDCGYPNKEDYAYYVSWEEVIRLGKRYEAMLMYLQSLNLPNMTTTMGQRRG